jgi:chaperonin cofactor prefoldin
MPNKRSALDDFYERSGEMKKRIAVLLLLVVGSRAFASGFPTVDVAVVAQNVTDYVNQLEQLQQQVESVAYLDASLVQMIRDYEQVLKEYDHLVKMMKGLPNDIESFGDHIDFNIDPVTGQWDVGILTDAGYKDVDDAVATVYSRTREMSDITDDYTTIGYTGSTLTRATREANAAYTLSRLEAARQIQANRLNDGLNEDRAIFTDDITPEVERISGSSENQLEVLQMLLTQNQQVIKQLQSINEAITTHYRDSGKLDADVFAQRARGMERELCIQMAAVNDTSNAGC